MDLWNAGIGQGQLADVGIDGGLKPCCASLMPENSIIAPHTKKQGKTSTQWFFHFLVQVWYKTRKYRLKICSFWLFKHLCTGGKALRCLVKRLSSQPVVLDKKMLVQTMPSFGKGKNGFTWNDLLICHLYQLSDLNLELLQRAKFHLFIYLFFYV